MSEANEALDALEAAIDAGDGRAGLVAAEKLMAIAAADADLAAAHTAICSNLAKLDEIKALTDQADALAEALEEFDRYASVGDPDGSGYNGSPFQVKVRERVASYRKTASGETEG